MSKGYELHERWHKGGTVDMEAEPVNYQAWADQAGEIIGAMCDEAASEEDIAAALREIQAIQEAESMRRIETRVLVGQRDKFKRQRAEALAWARAWKQAAIENRRLFRLGFELSTMGEREALKMLKALEREARKERGVREG